MVDRAWIERQGDALIVHTNYMRCIFKAQDMHASTQRGGELITAVDSVTSYMRALECNGMMCDYTIPA
jgi:hypothetical protein